VFGLKAIDAGRAIDWSKTSADYGQYRPGQPASFFERLQVLGLGRAGQRSLDLGTGTGDLARQFAKQGCIASGSDVAEGQIEMAKALAEREHLGADFYVAPAHVQPFAPASFDCITANQCWLYFDQDATLAEVRRVLKPGGQLCVSYSAWLPYMDAVAYASEQLVLHYNPQWGGKLWQGVIPPSLDGLKDGFVQRAMFFYDEPIPFTRESWRGRMRACRGTGATLAPEQLAAFDAEHASLLERIAPESFTVLHRISAHIVSPIVAQP
jgi:SAM-dependent methyltransferase